MKTWMLLPLALTIAIGIACDRGDRGRSDGSVGTSGASRVADGDFIEDQLADGDAEVAMGRLAQDRASNAEVREFAAMMVRDHEKAGAELKQIAGRHDLHADKDRHDDHAAMQERLAERKGADFDREYIDAMVTDHEKAVDDVKGKAERSDNPEVKQWASSTLSTLQQHLDRAKQLQTQLRNAGSPGR